jgi:monoamine oxidase
LSADFDIVVVGAGAAGIAAAMRLAQAGRSTLLLEADSRAGGRAWTHRIRGLDLDLGCGWLHSADRNGWMEVARMTAATIDRTKPAWGTQYQDLGFTRAEQVEARQALAAWLRKMSVEPPAGDCAADALERGQPWNSYIRAIAGFISGAPLEDVSIADYVAYEESSTDENWRVPMGYGTLIARSLPDSVRARFATPLESLTLNAEGVTLATPAGSIRARTAILTVSTHVLAGDTIKLPPGLSAWREASAQLPLGRNEKLFLQVASEGPFEPETQVFGNPRDAHTGAYYIRPMDMPVIECFFGGESAQVVEDEGPAAGFAFALDQLASLFGAEVRRLLKPLVASYWGRMDRIGGAYSYARPGQNAARPALAKPFEQRIFFAGEATSAGDFSTAHGAYDSGVRAAEEAIAALSAR